MTPTGRVAVCTERSNAINDVRYFHSDGLGSITAVTDELGRVVKRFAFDAWGKRVDPATNAAITTSTNGGFTRGFTDHEQLDSLGLVHMNGRVYDPVLGRFLSADSFVGDVGDSQDYNRYSYLGNNPLGGTDPSGYFSLKDAVKIVAVVAVAYFTAGAALWAMGYGTLTAAGTAGAAFSGTVFSAAANIGAATLGAAIGSGAAAGFASGFAGSLLNGGNIGDAFKAGVIGGIAGGISAGLFHGIGAGLEGMEHLNTFEREGLRALGHGVVGGGMEAATGGQFRHGFYAGAAAAVGSFGIAKYGGDWGVAGRTAAAAVVGGTASSLGGGKFANGAVTGSFSHLFNYESTLKRLSQRLSPEESEYLKRHPGSAIGIIRSTKEALEEAARLYPASIANDGNGDAFRHAYWNALLTRRVGAQIAEEFTTLHEGNSTTLATKMDLFNNAVGRSVALSGNYTTHSRRVFVPTWGQNQLADGVVNALNSGQLRVIDRGALKATSPGP